MVKVVSNKRARRVLSGLGLVILALSLFIVSSGFSWAYRIYPGTAAAVITYGRGEDGQAKIDNYNAGQVVNVDTNYQQLIAMPIGQQTSKMLRRGGTKDTVVDESIRCFDRDLVRVQVDLVLHWRVDPDKIGQLYLLRQFTVGDGKDVQANLNKLSDDIIERLAREIAPNVCGQYEYTEILATKKAEFDQKVQEALVPELAKYYLRLDGVSTGEPYLTDNGIYDAIQNEAVQIIRNRSALSEAAANAILRESLSPEQQLARDMIEKWDGHLPMYLSGDTSGLPIPVIPQPTPTPAPSPTATPKK